MDINPTELQRCHLVYRNVHEMLADRNYDIDERSAALSTQEFRNRFGQHPNRRQMLLIYEKRRRIDADEEESKGNAENLPEKEEIDLPEEADEEGDDEKEEDNAEKEEDGENSTKKRKVEKNEKETVENSTKIRTVEQRETKQDAEDDDRKDDGPIVVYFATDSKVKVGAVRELVKLMLDKEAQDAILVVQAGITSSANTALKQLVPRLRIQIFLEQEMLCMSSILHHEKQPKFTILSRRQKTAVLTKYKMKESQLPRMLAVDPIARYYGLKPGQVVKVVRKSETAGRYTTYRVVVAADLKLPKLGTAATK